MTNHLKDKVIVITGGGRGIGKEIAQFCANEDARVVIAARSPNELEKVKASSPQIQAIQCDVSVESDVKKLIEQTESETGPIYGLICAAGVYGPIGHFEDNDFSDWQKSIEINLIGTARTIHTVLPFMKKRKEGRIILFSGGGQAALPHFSSYVTSKGGIWRLTETLGSELESTGIFINSIAPGAVNTKLLDDILEAGSDQAGKAMYDRSLKQKNTGGTPAKKAANCVLYLLSNEARGLTGKTLSAVWDPYLKLVNPTEVSKTDLYTFKRVVDSEGGTRPKN